MATTLTILGLLTNMAGTAITFFFGYPQPSHEESVALTLSDGTPLSDGETVGQYGERVRRRKRTYALLSKLGLVLTFLGFALQFFAVFKVP